MNYKKKYLKYKKKYLNKLTSLSGGSGADSVDVKAATRPAAGSSQAPLHKLPGTSDNSPTTSNDQSVPGTSGDSPAASGQQSVPKTSDNSPATSDDQSVPKTPGDTPAASGRQSVPGTSDNSPTTSNDQSVPGTSGDSPAASGQQSVPKTSDNSPATSDDQSVPKTPDNSPTTSNDQSVPKTSDNSPDTSEGSPDDAQLDATHETKLNESLKKYFEAMLRLQTNISSINIPLRNYTILKRHLDNVKFFPEQEINHDTLPNIKKLFEQFILEQTKGLIVQGLEQSESRIEYLKKNKKLLSDYPELKKLLNILEQLDINIQFNHIEKKIRNFNEGTDLDFNTFTNDLNDIIKFLKSIGDREDLNIIVSYLSQFHIALYELNKFLGESPRDFKKSYIEQKQNVDQELQVQEQLLILQTQVNSLTEYIGENKPDKTIEKINEDIGKTMNDIEDRLKTTDHEEFKRYVNTQLIQLRQICQDCSAKEKNTGICSIM